MILKGPSWEDAVWFLPHDEILNCSVKVESGFLMVHTFKVSPNIFTQVLTVLGIRRRTPVRRHNGDEEDDYTEEDGVPLHFVYAFLSGKQTQQYAAVLYAVRNAVNQYRANECTPERIMCDFKNAIIDASAEVFPEIPVTRCFIHQAQSV